MNGASGLSEYVQNSGQILDAGNYNEMDALVLASLSYIEFEKIYPDYQGRNVTVQQFAKDALAAGIDLPDTKRALLEQIQNSDRYSECTIHHMAAENETSQWAAMTVDINDGTQTSVIAMRGTDGTELGWNEDFQLAYADDGTQAQKLSAAYLQDSTASNIFLTGHSKGGNDVTSAYVMSDASVRDRVVHIDNFDGPGVNDEFRDLYRQGYAELDGKLDNYYPENSVIGLLLNDNPGQENFVRCDTSEEYSGWWIFGEHDPYCWQFDEENGGFRRGDQSELSETLNQLLDNTLEEMSQQERRDIVQAIIGMQGTALIAQKETLYEQSADAVEETLQQLYGSHALFGWQKDLYGGILKNVARIAAGFYLYSRLSEEQKQALRKTLGLVLENAAEIYLMPKVDAMLDWLAEQYRFVARVISRKQAELAALITNFANTIHDGIGTWCNKVWELLFRDKQRRGQGSCGPTVLEVDAPALMTLSEELRAQQQMLQTSGREVRQVARALLGQLSVCAAWQVGRLADNVEDEARASGRMATALHQAGQQYSRTETQIAAAAGL